MTAKTGEIPGFLNRIESQIEVRDYLYLISFPVSTLSRWVVV